MPATRPSREPAVTFGLRIDSEDRTGAASRDTPAGVDEQAILVPAGMRHEFRNPGDEYATFILIMFGEGA